MRSRAPTVPLQAEPNNPIDLKGYLESIIEAVDTHPGLTLQKKNIIKDQIKEVVACCRSAQAAEELIRSQLEEMEQGLVKFNREHNRLLREKETDKKNPPDEMTGLPRKNAFMKWLAWNFKRETRGYVCAVAIIDIRNFSVINDRIGHDAGDVVILKLAEILKASRHNQPRRDDKARFPDFIARLGGDEFGICIMVADDGSENIEALLLGIVERYCAEFEKIQWAQVCADWAAALAKKPKIVGKIKPTLNPGVVIVHAGKKPRVIRSARPAVLEIMSRADKRMYESKEYEKLHRSRRIFYNLMRFDQREIVEVKQDSWQAPRM